MKIVKGRRGLPREIGVADVFDVGGRRPEGVDKLGQLVLHDELDVDVEEGDGERKERTLRHGMIT